MISNALIRGCKPLHPRSVAPWKKFHNFAPVAVHTAAGLPVPEYKQEQNHFISIIWRKRTNANGPQSAPQYLIDNKDIDNTDSQSGPQSGPHEKLVQRYRGLLETMIAKPTISKEELAAQFKISLTTLKRDLRCLRQSYEITWIGWTQNGHWEVKELNKKK